MKSQFTLSIKDSQVSYAYLLKRNRETLISSSVIWAVRLIILFVHIGKSVERDAVFKPLNWFLIGFQNAVQGFLILLSWKFPKIFCPLHGPITSLSFVINIYLNINRTSTVSTILHIMTSYT